MSVRLGNDAVGVLLAATSALAFSTLAIFAKLGYRAGAQALPLLTTRFTIAAILLFAVNAIRRVPWGNTRRNVRLVALGALGYGFESLLFFGALERAPAAAVGLVFYSFPLWTALLSLATGLERFRPRLVIALGLGTGGVALVFASPLEGVSGLLLALAAAVAVSVYLIVAQVVARGADSVSASAWTAAGAAVALGATSAVAGRGLPAGALGPAAALGLATVAAFVLLYASIARIGSARSSVALMIEPVATVVLAAIVLDEEMTWTIVAGTVLIVAALPVVAMRSPETVAVPRDG